MSPRSNVCSLVINMASISRMILSSYDPEAARSIIHDPQPITHIMVRPHCGIVKTGNLSADFIERPIDIEIIKGDAYCSV
jgi:hypothetical protein